MTWKDQLRPASYRGVRFHVDSADTTVGRRTVTHEYPGRDRPYTEDLGRRRRQFRVEGYVIGPDYMRARDALRAALEKPSPGTLVHPYLGTLKVAVSGEVRIRESTRRGGMAEFTIPFVEAGGQAMPAQSADTPRVTVSEAGAAIAAAKAAAAERFGTSELAPTALEKIQGAVQSAVDTVSGLADAVPTNPEALAQFRSQVTDLRNSVTQLVEAPADLAAGVAGAVQDVGYLATDLSQLPDRVSDLFDGTVSRFEAAFQQFQQLGGYETPFAAPASPATAEERQQRANLAAIQDLLRRTATIEAARASAAVEPETSDRALEIADWVAEALDELLVTAGDTAAHPDTPAGAVDAEDEAAARMRSLRAAAVTDLRTRAAQLPRLMAYTLPEMTPALVVAHRVYGDAGRHEEIVNRNNVRHPGQIPGGAVLEVLSDG